jgi:hypothetical protein
VERTGCPPGALAQSHSAAYNTTVSLAPQQTFIEPAGQCTLQIAVGEPGDSIGCIECHVSFDTSLVTLIAAEEGSLFAEAGVSTFFRHEIIAPDTHSVVDCLLGYRTYFLPPGELARLIFQGKREGTCPVYITFIRLWDINRIQFFPGTDPAAWIHIGTTTGTRPAGFDPVRMSGFPNPFSDVTTISVPADPDPPPGAERRMTVSVYDAGGRHIAVLFDGLAGEGEQRLQWRGFNRHGHRVPSGVYFVEARTRKKTYRTKVTLIH